MNKFENAPPHFLDLEIHPDGITIYRKDTHTGQYTHFDSVTTWNHKIAWIRSLVNRAQRICSPGKLNLELSNIRRFASYNGFPSRVINGIIKKVSKQTLNQNLPGNAEQEDAIYFSLPYQGQKGESIVKSCKRINYSDVLRRIIRLDSAYIIKPQKHASLLILKTVRLSLVIPRLCINLSVQGVQNYMSARQAEPCSKGH